MTTIDIGRATLVPALELVQDNVPFRSRRGRAIRFRQVTPGDTCALAELLQGLSPETIHLRYFLPRPRFAPEEARQEALRLVGGVPRDLVLLGLVEARGQEQAIAIAELVRDAAHSAVGEVGLVVADAYQGEGIGSALGAELLARAAWHGVSTMRASALDENTPVRRLIARLGLPYTVERSQGVITFQGDIRGYTPRVG